MAPHSRGARSTVKLRTVAVPVRTHGSARSRCPFNSQAPHGRGALYVNSTMALQAPVFMAGVRVSVFWRLPSIPIFSTWRFYFSSSSCTLCALVSIRRCDVRVAYPRFMSTFTMALFFCLVILLLIWSCTLCALVSIRRCDVRVAYASV